MEISQGQLGPEAKYSLKFSGGKLLVELEYQGAELMGGVKLGLGVDQLMDALKAAIPGQFDDMVIELAKQALKAL